MNNPIIRQVSAGTLRRVHLSIRAADEPVAGADCEVTELDGEEGWKRWQDSVFVQDFEDSVLSAPAPLFDDLKPSN